MRQRIRSRVVRRLSLAVAALTVGATLSVTALAAAPLPRLLAAEFGSFSVRPPQMVMSGDGSDVIGGNAPWVGRNPDPQQLGSQLGHITWTVWTATGATGIGVQWLDNCKPNCAEGTYFPQTVKLAASRAAAGVYSRLALTFAKGERTEHFTLQHINSGPNGYVWG